MGVRVNPDRHEGKTAAPLLVKILSKWKKCRCKARRLQSPKGTGDPMVFISIKRALRTAAALAVLAAPSLLAASTAQAQSPMPFGLWQGQNSGDYILIKTGQDLLGQRDSQCRRQVRMALHVGGRRFEYVLSDAAAAGPDRMERHLDQSQYASDQRRRAVRPALMIDAEFYAAPHAIPSALIAAAAAGVVRNAISALAASAWRAAARMPA